MCLLSAAALPGADEAIPSTLETVAVEKGNPNTTVFYDTTGAIVEERIRTGNANGIHTELRRLLTGAPAKGCVISAVVFIW